MKDEKKIIATLNNFSSATTETSKLENKRVRFFCLCATQVLHFVLSVISSETPVSVEFLTGSVTADQVKMCLRSVSDRNQLILVNFGCTVGGGAVE